MDASSFLFLSSHSFSYPWLMLNIIFVASFSPSDLHETLDCQELRALVIKQEGISDSILCERRHSNAPKLF